MSLFAALALAVFCSLLLPATGSAVGTGTIKGKVVDAVSGTGINEVVVCPFELPEIQEFECEETDASGAYTLSGLPTGIYYVEFWADYLGYLTQYYNDKSRLEDATPVEIISPETVSGIDGHLSKSAVIVVPPVIPVVPAVQIPSVLPAPAPQPPKPTTLHCKKGFKKATKHGKKVCVKIKHHKKHH